MGCAGPILLANFFLSFILCIQYIPQLLSALDSETHCLAIVDSDRLFFTGLGEEQKETWLYSKTSNNLTKQNPMPTGRSWAGCGVVRNGILSKSMTNYWCFPPSRWSYSVFSTLPQCFVMFSCISSKGLPWQWVPAVSAYQLEEFPKTSSAKPCDRRHNALNRIK